MSEVSGNKKLKILVVEDNALNAKFAEAVLKRLGYDVDFAINGKIGVEKFLENDYDLILMDIQMPVMDGLEATRKIREYESQLGNNKHIPILAVTAFAMEHDRENCLEAGMDEYLTKPYRPAQLEELIKMFFPGA
jgi:CheY-like chemotaxis protein